MIRQWKQVSDKDHARVRKLFEDLGVEIEISTTYCVQELILKKGNKSVRLASGFNIFEPEYPKKDVYVVSGTIAGMKIREEFPDHDKAWARKVDLDYYTSPDKGDKVEIASESVDVLQ